VMWLSVRLVSRNIRPERQVVSHERPLATNREQMSA
jgi:hypothetical protein